MKGAVRRYCSDSIKRFTVVSANIGFPAKERVKKCQTSSFRGAGTAREPGTHEHRTSSILEIQVFLGSGLGSSGRPGMTFLGKNNSLTCSKAGTHLNHGHRPAPVWRDFWRYH
jgi:hypothetical protein